MNRRLAGAFVALFILSAGGKALAAPNVGTLDLLVIDPAMNGAVLAASTPGPSLAGFDPSNAIIDLTFSLSGAEGNAPDATLRLTALGVAPSVPEPAVWSLLAIGGLALARRRELN